MPALEAGVQAPEINLELLSGERFSLAEARKHGPVVVAFFKISCPVCQFAFPYLEKIFKAYGKSGKFTLVGVSQDDAADTRRFNREFGISFPVLLDPPGKYPASNAYGLTNVPSIFVVSPDGEIESSSVGWSKQDIERLNQMIGGIAGQQVSQVFRPGESVPEFRPG